MGTSALAIPLEIFLVEHGALLAQSPTGTIVGRVIGPAGPVVTGISAISIFHQTDKNNLQPS
jgi:hypothetical protein